MEEIISTDTHNVKSKIQNFLDEGFTVKKIVMGNEKNSHGHENIVVVLSPPKK